jgi:hypothetical protein
MTVGDLVKYDVRECDNQVPGLVVGFENTSHEIDYLQVQWFDWAVGEIALEHPSALVLVSKANETR